MRMTEDEILPFLNYWRDQPATFRYGYESVDDMYDDSIISDGSFYPKGVRYFEFEQNGFYCTMYQIILAWFGGER